MTKQASETQKQTKSFGPFPQQAQVTPNEAKKYRENREIPSDLVMLELSSSSRDQSAMAGGNPLAISSIPEQARALRNDIDLIYQYVHDKVDFIPTYGLHKGGLGALIDGSGNQFDQCDLMVRLLNQPGSTYSAEYVIGQVKLTAAQWSTWLGVAPSDWTLALSIFNNGGIAVHGINTEPDGTVSITFEHCWVKANIGGTNYYFDPSVKAHTATTGINLATAMNYNRSTFLSDAKATATINPGVSVKDISAASINSHLQDYSTNLLSWIKQNNPGASLDDVVGGRSIVPTDTVRNTTLPYAAVIDEETSTIPDPYKCFFRFEYDFDSSSGNYVVNVGGFTDIIYGQRLTLFWNASGQAGVYFNGTQSGSLSRAKVDGAIENARITVIHPYSFAYQQSLQPVIGRAPAWIGTCFGLGSKNLAQIHQELQNGYISQGLPASSEALLGQSLSLIWDNFIGQSSDGIDILKRISNTEIVLHHFVGLVTQAKKPGTTTNIKSISSFMSNWNTSPKATGLELTSTNLTLGLFVQSLEGTAAEQVSGIESGDAIKAISITNQAHVDIFEGNNSNWTTGANVRSTLSNGGAGWSNSLLIEMDGYLGAAADWRVIVPKNPNVTIGSFSDFYGYFAYQPTSISPLHGLSLFSNTWFGAKGAASASGQDDAGTNAAASDNARQTNGFGMPAVTETESARVNMLNGRYEYSSTDLSVGNQGAPYELSFTRSYNSALRLSLAKVSSADNGLGFGWTHNWLMKVGVNSDGFICLGSQQVSAATPAIATLFVMRDVALSNTAMPVENFVIECEIARFLIKQFSKNVVRVQAGGSTLMFLKMPDGAYLPPMGAHGKTKLELKSTPTQHFEYTTSDGVVYTYKSTGEIETIAYPFGITITFTYTTGRLSKVSNGFRDLNFTYDTFGQLATVNDGNGRTVTFTVPTSGGQAGNLTAVTNSLSKTTTYNYDQRGRLTQVFKPANPSSPIFTNVYDTLSRVKEQRDAYNNLWQFFIAGTRSEEIAPNGTSRVQYFNKAGSPVSTINALGQKVTAEYDGNQRVTKQTLPEGNSVETFYDADGNATIVTQKAKPGSGIADRSTHYSYDPVWNKMASATDTAGNSTSYEYYGVGSSGASLQKKITAPAVSAGIAVTIFEYNGLGQLTRTIDPTALVTLNTYNPANKNNLISQTVDPSPGLNINTAFEYDSVGNRTKFTDPNGNATTFMFDALRRVTQTIGVAPFSQSAYIGYDDNGNVIATRSLDPADLNTEVVTCTYSIDGKLLTSTGSPNYADGAQPTPMRYEYDELRRLVKSVDALGREATTSYDALSRQSVLAVEGVPQQALTYTENGQLKTISDARTNVTTYLYDGLDRLTRSTYPDSSFEEFSHDGLDNINQITTRSGGIFQFEYDAAGQIVTKTAPGMPIISFTYDLAGRSLSISTPAVVGDPSTGTFSFGYDTAGRMTQEQTPDGKIVSVQLDQFSNAVKLTHPSGSQVTKIFDGLNRLKSISGIGGKVTFEYDTVSRRVGQFNSNLTGEGYGFDKIDNLSAYSGENE